jgi:hypothetical protein
MNELNAASGVHWAFVGLPRTATGELSFPTMRWHAPRARRHTKRAGQAIPKDPSADQINQSGRSDTESIPTGLIGTLLKNQRLGTHTSKKCFSYF